MHLPSWIVVAAAGLQFGPSVYGQRTGSSSQNDTLGLSHGLVSLTNNHFSAELVKDAQVLVSLKEPGSSSSPFDFLPRDRLTSRARNGQHHWGDVNLSRQAAVFIHRQHHHPCKRRPDEAGAGSFLAAAAKQAVLLDAVELAVLVPLLTAYYGELCKTGTPAATIHTARGSAFFHDPAVLPKYTYNKSLDWSSWTSWTRIQACATDRAYDYVHVVATYWAMYRAARSYPDEFTAISKNYTFTAFTPTSQNPPWMWYLRQASETVQRTIATANSGACKAQHANDGLMGETVIVELLRDLQREVGEVNNNINVDWIQPAVTAIESQMRVRARRWSAASVPFGSEMAWDSTAQEGVHLWASHFGDRPTAQNAVGTVLGFMPSVPHWAWDGNARRYWDNDYGRKLARIERQVNHYGSALNGLVLLRAATGVDVSSKDIAHLVRLGYAGTSAPLTNVGADGFASASFHSFPDTLAWDAYSGDYGPGFLGMVLCGGTFLVQDTELLSTGRLLCYGGILSETNTTTTVQPRDSWQKRFFWGPLGLSISIDAGIIDTVSPSSSEPHSLSLTLKQREDGPHTDAAVLRLSSTSTSAKGVTYTVALGKQSGTAITRPRGGWQVPLQGTKPVTLTITIY